MNGWHLSFVWSVYSFCCWAESSSLGTSFVSRIVGSSFRCLSSFRVSSSLLVWSIMVRCVFWTSIRLVWWSRRWSSLTLFFRSVRSSLDDIPRWTISWTTVRSTTDRSSWPTAMEIEKGKDSSSLFFCVCRILLLSSLSSINQIKIAKNWIIDTVGRTRESRLLVDREERWVSVKANDDDVSLVYSSRCSSSIFVSIRRVNDAGKSRSNSLIDRCSSATRLFSLQEIPDLFDLSYWRLSLIGAVGNQTMCRVPSAYLPIANAFCHAQRRVDCPEIPCPLVSLSADVTREVRCLRGGRRSTSNRFDWRCRKSPALELFDNPFRKPSIIAEGYTEITEELYAEALFPYHDVERTKWGLSLEGESIGYYPSVVRSARLMSLFDMTIGYDRRYFDVITDAHLGLYQDRLLSRRVTFEEISRRNFSRRPSILWINSNCETPSNRTSLMLELMKYIRVDVRGRCGNPLWNASNTAPVDPSIWAEEKTRLAGEYLFTIAIENSLEYDYVTEKLWQPLASGSVPIYLGAPNVDDWLPCSNLSCLVDLRRFSSMKETATFLQSLIDDREKYLFFHQWRRETPVRKTFLHLSEYLNRANEHSLECLLCDLIHRNDRGELRRTLRRKSNPFEHAFPRL